MNLGAAIFLDNNIIMGMIYLKRITIKHLSICKRLQIWGMLMPVVFYHIFTKMA